MRDVGYVKVAMKLIAFVIFMLLAIGILVLVKPLLYKLNGIL